MALKQLIPEIVRDIQDNRSVLDVNRRLFEIYEGDLVTQLQEKICAEFSIDTQRDLLTRMTPINILTRIVDKMSQIYTDGPTRTVMNGTDKDQELLDWYQENFDIDNVMNSSNELFNFSGSSLLEPFVSNGRPHLRVIPSHQFWVHSTDNVLQVPTEIITFAEDKTSVLEQGEVVDTLFAYSADEFLVTDNRGNIDLNKMAELNNQGINPFGQLPFVYLNRSKYKLVPVPDIDMLKMSLIIPMLLTDLNYAVKYQSFATTYGIDLDFGNLRKAPNAFWDLKSKTPGEGTPQIGTIKPEVDIDQVLNLISSEMAMWLNTKGIKTSSIGDINSSNFSSGISKLIDEMDIVELRKKQISIFQQAEESELWELVLKKMHPIWVKAGMIENTAMFSPSASVSVDFTPPVPMIRRNEIIQELKEELEAGFTTKKRAISRLNPRMTDSEVDDLIADIEEEKVARMPVPFFAENQEEQEDEEETEA